MHATGPIAILLSGLFGGVAAFWIGLAMAAAFGLRTMPRVARPPSHAGASPEPACTIVLAARDEAARLEQTVERALAQRGVNLRVVAVDDRSSDDTPAILTRLAQRDARLIPVRVDDLPPGWLGKCHALHQGAQHAGNAEWLLFIDADTWLHPDASRAGIDLAVRTGSRHVCFAPAMASTTLPGRATLLAGMTLFAARALGVRMRMTYMGVGAYNLLDANIYRALGGHERLRMDVVDDVKLALLANRAGARTRLALAPELVEVEWAGSARGFVRLLEKNGFASLNYSLVRTVGATAVALAMLLAPLATCALLATNHQPLRTAAALCALAWFVSVLPAWRLAHRFGWRPINALLAPLGYWVILAAGLNSTTRTLRNGGVTWRGVRYPLADLRRGVVR